MGKAIRTLEKRCVICISQPNITFVCLKSNHVYQIKKRGGLVEGNNIFPPFVLGSGNPESSVPWVLVHDPLYWSPRAFASQRWLIGFCFYLRIINNVSHNVVRTDLFWQPSVLRRLNSVCGLTMVFSPYRKARPMRTWFLNPRVLKAWWPNKPWETVTGTV